MDANGTFETEWTLCKSCLDLAVASGKINAKSTSDKFLTFASRPSEFIEYSALKLTDNTTQEILIGAQADPVLAAFRTAKEERLARQRLKEKHEAEEEKLYGQARRAYRSFAQNHKQSPLAKARIKKCRTLKLRETPDIYDTDLDEFEYRMEQNVERFETHIDCVTQFLENVDYADYAENATKDDITEAELWDAANLPNNQRVRVLSVEEMVEEEEKYVTASSKAFEKRAKAFEKSWDRHVAYEKKEAKRRAESKRRAQINRDTEQCIMGLIARSAITPYSRGYCEAQAKKGIGGFDAALLGSAGAKPAPVYRQPTFEELGKFDLAGMMDNARRAAETNNPGMLWDKSGRIRTTRAPSIARSTNTTSTSTPNRSNKKSSAPQQSTPPKSDTSAAMARARDAAAKARTEQAEAQKVAEAAAQTEADAEAQKEAQAEAKRLDDEKKAAKKKEREKEKRRKDALKSLRASITPFKGGEKSCVEVVKINRIPGKKVNSSCSYSEPDREALELTFLNRCTMPVNIEIDLAYDTGEFRQSGEYDIRPGRKKTTVGYCGATNYNWRFEETRDSVERRRDEAEAKFNSGSSG